MGLGKVLIFIKAFKMSSTLLAISNAFMSSTSRSFGQFCLTQRTVSLFEALLLIVVVVLLLDVEVLMDVGALVDVVALLLVLVDAEALLLVDVEVKLVKFGIGGREVERLRLRECLLLRPRTPNDLGLSSDMVLKSKNKLKKKRSRKNLQMLK